MHGTSRDRIMAACLACAACLPAAGCRSAPPGPIAGYTGIIRSASPVPGQPGKFRLLVRIRSNNGQPVAFPPDLSIVDPGATARLTYTARRVSADQQTFCDLLVHGSIGRPLTAPTTLTIAMIEQRELPTWWRLITSGSTQSYSEVSARTTLGALVLKPERARGPEEKQPRR
jgi:hypothetical protein